MLSCQRQILRKLGSYRFRIGNYRVIFDIDEDKLVILRVGHRKNIYRGI
ncbi:MAG: type II toxin-antitoxin system RelE/ParE family toxin [Candidatus Cloacimonetes bacterium]|nr:type II toxin-antitoxin system RelE/ParE family toxin [Candidatus Cloacimonadota bacterium]